MEQDLARIAEQAAEYFARRTPGARPPGRDGLDEWLRADARHVAAYEETRRTWNQLDPLRDDPGLQALMRADLKAERLRQGFSRYLPMLAAAAVLVLVVVLGGYFHMQHLATPAPVSYATNLGERRTELLADGSRIVLNTGTVLQARYAHDSRQVDLEQGEAQFDVARDATRPFTVLAGDARVSALGTRFQVRREAGLIRVTLLEGRVEVVRNGERRILAPNQQASWNSAGAMEVSTVDPEMAASWLQGLLRFRATPLAQVIAEANRYSTHKLRLGDPTLAGVELSGVFTAGDNVSIASAASMILPVRAEVRGAEIVLLPQ